jgi:hypothetical protein
MEKLFSLYLFSRKNKLNLMFRNFNVFDTVGWHGGMLDVLLTKSNRKKGVM